MAGEPPPGPGAPIVRPPEPERRPVRLEAHGDVRVDDWYWLRDKDDPAVIGHLEAENAYTEAVLSGTERLRQVLYDEMVARIEETDLSVPVRKGSWLYYGRTVEGSSYGIHCRRPVGTGGTGPDGADPGVSRTRDGGPEGEQVLLDENELARGHEYFAVGNLEVSPDHAVYVGDTVRYDIRGARNAGIIPIHFDPYDLCETRNDHEHVRAIAEVELFF